MYVNWSDAIDTVNNLSIWPIVIHTAVEVEDTNRAKILRAPDSEWWQWIISHMSKLDGDYWICLYMQGQSINIIN